MNEAREYNPKNPYENDPQIMTLCFEVNALLRRSLARKQMTLLTPVPGDHVFLVPESGVSQEQHILFYRIASVSDKNTEGQRTVVAKAQDQPILVGTFTSKGYDWPSGYVDLRQYVTKNLSKWNGHTRLKKDFQCLIQHYPFVTPYLDKF